MSPRRIEGQAAVIRADKVDPDKKPNRRRGKHKGQMISADGRVEIEITKQYPVSEPSDSRPPEGTVVKADHAEVNARLRGKVHPDDGDPKRHRVNVNRGFDAILRNISSRRSKR